MDTATQAALAKVRAALEGAPNPRQVDGPPALWDWYDEPRLEALAALDLITTQLDRKGGK